MPRPKLAVPSVEKNVAIPLDLAMRVDLELYSEVEGKVPFGAWKGFLTRLLRQHFERQAAAEELTKAMRAAEEITDIEQRHMTMDRLLVEFAAANGAHTAATIFHMTRKHYA